MSKADYAVAMTHDQADALGRVRGIACLKILVDDDTVWVRGPLSDDGVVTALKTLPGEHYSLNLSGALTPMGNYLATRHLTAGDVNWTPIQQWLVVNRPTGQWPPAVGNRVPLQLVPSDRIVSAAALLTSVKELATFVCSVPEIRFQHLSFTMNDLQQVFVTGDGLPPVYGRRFWMAGRIAIPAGRKWTPAVDATCLSEVFGSSTDTVVWYENEVWERITAESFAPVTRAAVRASESQLR